MRIIRIAAPFVFILVGVLLFLQIAQPALTRNRQATKSLSERIEQLSSDLDREAPPSRQAVEKLRMRLDLLRKKSRESGTIVPEPANENLQTILKEWGYTPKDPIVQSLIAIENDLTLNLSSRYREGIRTFVNNMARMIGDAGIVTSLTMTVETGRRTRTRHGEEGLSLFLLNFSFISGITEAILFSENWICNRAPGVLIKPEKMSFMRIEPDLWGTQLNDYSSPPIRTDLVLSVSFNDGKS